MQKMWNKITSLVLLAAILSPFALLAQKDEKEEKDKKEVQQIIITRKGDKAEKVVIEINGDKVTVNGKSLDELKDKNSDISVRMNKLKDMEALTVLRGAPRGGAWNFNGDGGNVFNFSGEDANRAMLGVNTEKADEGAEVVGVTKESAAEKIGLKEGDIIVKVDDTKIESPDNLSEAIKSHKPGDKVTVKWIRDKKEMKATAELTKWKGMGVFGGNGQNFKFDMGDMNLQEIMPKIEGFRSLAPFGENNWSWSGGGSPKLGLSVQDTDDGKGVKVVEVDEESNAAKAGIKEEDIITHVDDKEVKGVDEIARLLKEKKENPTVRFQVIRNGKSQNIEVKMPRKIKTADL